MTPRRLVVLVAACASLLLPLAAPTPSRRRGNQTSIATNWNLTSTSTTLPTPSLAGHSGYDDDDDDDDDVATSATSLAVVVTPSSGWQENPTVPISGTGPGSQLGNHTRAPFNYSGTPCTVNVPQASIDWWYAATYGFAVGTLRTAPGNFTQPHMTNKPNTATFDVASALSEPAWTPSITYDPQWDITFTYMEEYTVKPSATITSVVSRTAYAPIPPGKAIPQDELALYQSDLDTLDPATLAIHGSNGTGFTATSATPVVYFAAYEVETALPFTANDGHVTRTTITQTFTLPHPYAAPYWVKGIENSAVVEGTVPPEFLELIPQASCSAGTLTSSVTVVVVVDLYYAQEAMHNPFKIHIESTVVGWEEEEIGVQGTEVFTPPPETEGVPRVEITADGFMSPSASIKPAVIPTNSPSRDTGGQGSPNAVPNAPEPTKHTVGSVGTAPIVIGPSSVVVVGSETLSRGSQITVGGNPVSLNPSGNAIVVGSSTSFLPPVFVQDPSVPRPPPILTIGRSTLTPNAATQFFLGPGQTLTPGGIATLDGTTISLGSSALFVVVGGSTQFLPPAPAPAATTPPTIVIGGSTFTRNPGSSFVIGSQTLNVGDSITVDSTVISLGPSFVVVDQATSTFPAALPASGRSEITLGSSTITADAQGNFVVNGQTLMAGGPAITVDGSTTLALAGDVLVSNGVSSTIANAAAQITPPPLTIGNGVFTAIPGSGTTYLIGNELLTPGGVVTVSGTTISLAPGATALVINGVTTALNPLSPITNAPLLTIGSETYTAVSGSTFVIKGHTLTPGGVITIDGTTIRLAPGATELIVESSGGKSTTTLFPATTTRDQDATATGAAGPGASGWNGGPAQTASSDGLQNVRLNIGLLVLSLLAFSVLLFH